MMLRSWFCLLLASSSCYSLTLTSSSSSSSFFSQIGISKNTDENFNAFQLPTFGLLLIVHEQGAPTSQSDLPSFLQTLTSSSVDEELTIPNREELLKAQAISLHSFAELTSVAKDNNDVQEAHKIWVYDPKLKESIELLTKSMMNTGKQVLFVEKEEDRLDAELSLLKKTVNAFIVENRARPALIVHNLYGIIPAKTNEEKQALLGKLGATVQQITHEYLEKYTSRPLITLTFTDRIMKEAGDTEISFLSKEQVSEVQRKLKSTATVAPFQGSDYVIMCWTMVAFSLLVIFVFFCIPWAPELDPALRASLKSDSKLE